MTPAREAEAERVDLVYFWALQQLGNAMAVDALALWRDAVPPSAQAAASGSGWLTRVIALLFGFRRKAQDLAIAYYRLNRALRTGFAPTVGEEREGQTITLDQLREEFEQIVDEIDEATAGDDEFRNGNPENDIPETPMPDLEPAPGDAEIGLESIADIDELIAAADEAAQEEALEAFNNLGTNNLVKKAAKADEIEDGDQRDAARGEAHEAAGYRQAAAAMRIMMNAARGLAYDLSALDARVIGWVRYSQSGSPCAFCAMLISRQVYYKNARAAQHQGANQEEDKYHDNCRCVAVPIFDVEQFENSPLYDQNRYYWNLWQEHIQGEFSGEDALKEWRVLLRKLRNEQRQTQAPAAA